METKIQQSLDIPQKMIVYAWYTLQIYRKSTLCKECTFLREAFSCIQPCKHIFAFICTYFSLHSTSICIYFLRALQPPYTLIIIQAQYSNVTTLQPNCYKLLRHPSIHHQSILPLCIPGSLKCIENMKCKYKPKDRRQAVKVGQRQVGGLIKPGRDVNHFPDNTVHGLSLQST